MILFKKKSVKRNSHFSRMVFFEKKKININSEKLKKKIFKIQIKPKNKRYGISN